MVRSVGVLAVFALGACAGAPPVVGVVEIAPPPDPSAIAAAPCPEGSHEVDDTCVADVGPSNAIPKWEPHGIGDPCASWGRPELGLENCDPSNEGDPDTDLERGAIVRALADAKLDLASCKTTKGPRGAGKIELTFGPNGKATAARAVGAPYEGTAAGACVAARFRGVKVPEFRKKPSITVTASFVID